MIQRRTWLAGTGAALLGTLAVPARAQEFPKGPVKIVIPFPPADLPTPSAA